MEMDKAALDRHITGNYGEDQFPDYDDEPDLPEQTAEEVAHAEAIANAEIDPRIAALCAEWAQEQPDDEAIANAEIGRCRRRRGRRSATGTPSSWSMPTPRASYPSPSSVATSPIRRECIPRRPAAPAPHSAQRAAMRGWAKVEGKRRVREMVPA